MRASDDDAIAAWEAGLSIVAAATELGVSAGSMKHHWAMLRRLGMLKPRHTGNVEQPLHNDGRPRTGEDWLLVKLREHHGEARYDIAPQLKGRR